MTEHYVTLFDSTFLPQGLALHHSLLEHGGDCLLWVLCLDAQCLTTLQRLNLPQMRLLDLAKLETPELLAVKPSRTRAEYCWTLTPWSIQWVFETESSVQRVTYLDADIYFLQSPSPIFREFEGSERAVLITEHGYAPEYDQTPISGRYCVQFLTVVRNLGEPILYWWRDRCLEWCFNRHEKDLFGDQKYLEKFEKLFPNLVFASSSNSYFQAPWNSSVHAFSNAIFFHFHGLRISSYRLIQLSTVSYIIPKPTLDFVYKPYCIKLLQLIHAYGLPFASQVDPPGMLKLARLKLKKYLISRIGTQLNPPYWFQVKKDSIHGAIW